MSRESESAPQESPRRDNVLSTVNFVKDRTEQGNVASLIDSSMHLDFGLHSFFGGKVPLKDCRAVVPNVTRLLQSSKIFLTKLEKNIIGKNETEIRVPEQDLFVIRYALTYPQGVVQVVHPRFLIGGWTVGKIRLWQPHQSSLEISRMEGPYEPKDPNIPIKARADQFEIKLITDDLESICFQHINNVDLSNPLSEFNYLKLPGIDSNDLDKSTWNVEIANELLKTTSEQLEHATQTFF